MSIRLTSAGIVYTDKYNSNLNRDYVLSHTPFTGSRLFIGSRVSGKINASSLFLIQATSNNSGISTFSRPATGRIDATFHAMLIQDMHGANVSSTDAGIPAFVNATTVYGNSSISDIINASVSKIAVNESSTAPFTSGTFTMVFEDAAGTNVNPQDVNIVFMGNF